MWLSNQSLYQPVGLHLAFESTEVNYTLTHKYTNITIVFFSSNFAFLQLE